MDNLLHKLKLSTGQRWYIEYYQHHPVDNSLVRIRETYQMNRIKSKKERKIFAYSKLIELKKLIPLGYPYCIDQAKKHQNISIAAAMERALLLRKITAGREASIPSYKSAWTLFSKWLTDKSYIDGKISLIDNTIAAEYIDSIVIDRQLSNRYRNNQLEFLKSLFNALLKKHIIPANPFVGIADLKVENKMRKPIHNLDKATMIQEMRSNDHGLLVCVLLLYYCFIRPAELRRLKIGDIDLSAGLIRISGAQSKNTRSEVVTIPDRLRDFLNTSLFMKYPASYYLIGKGMKPHETIRVGKNTIGNHHRAVMKRIKLVSPDSITLYSWKDTGVINLINNKVSLEYIRRQLRHKDLTTTQIYCQGLSQVSDQIRSLNDGLI